MKHLPTAPRRTLCLAVGGALALAVGSALPATAGSAPRTVTVAYQGGSSASAAGAYAYLFLSDKPGTLAPVVATARRRERSVRFRVLDNAGAPVAVHVSTEDAHGNGIEENICNGSDVVLPRLPPASRVLVDLVVGVCRPDGRSAVLSSPTQGTVTFSFGP